MDMFSAMNYDHYLVVGLKIKVDPHLANEYLFMKYIEMHLLGG